MLRQTYSHSVMETSLWKLYESRTVFYLIYSWGTWHYWMAQSVEWLAMSRSSGGQTPAGPRDFSFSEVSRPSHRPIWPTIQQVPECIPRGSGQGMKLTTHLYLALKLWMSGAILLLPLYVFIALTRTSLYLFTDRTVGILDCMALNGMLISKWWTGKDIEGSWHDLILCITPAFGWQTDQQLSVPRFETQTSETWSRSATHLTTIFSKHRGQQKLLKTKWNIYFLIHIATMLVYKTA